MVSISCSTFCGGKLIIKGRPIVKKNSRMATGRGYTIPSKAYRVWERDAIYQLSSYKEKYKGKVAVKLVFCIKGRFDADVDNLSTSVLDVLQKGGFIDDDKNVVVLIAEKYRGFKDWETHVTITPTQAVANDNKVIWTPEGRVI